MAQSDGRQEPYRSQRLCSRASLVDSTLRVEPESSTHDLTHIGPDPDAGEE